MGLRLGRGHPVGQRGAYPQSTCRRQPRAGRPNTSRASQQPEGSAVRPTSHTRVEESLIPGPESWGVEGRSPEKEAGASGGDEEAGGGEEAGQRNSQDQSEAMGA